MGHGRLAAIDFLRIFAAGSVVAYHYAYLFPGTSSALPVAVRACASYGYLGVEMFFMISGYLISLSAMGRTRWQFACARSARLWPAFLLSLSLTLAVSQHRALAVVLANVTMLPHLLGSPYVDGVYWSLMFEILFYLGIAILVISQGNFGRRLRTFAVSWLALAMIDDFIQLPTVKVLLALEYAPYFVVGIAVYSVRNGENTTWDRVFLLLSVMVACVFAMEQSKAIGGPTEDQHPASLICGVLVAMGAAAVYLSTGMRFGPIASRIALAVGGVSYPLYLLHNVFGAAMVGWIGPLGILVVVAVCYGVWRCEQPIRRQFSRMVRVAQAA